MKTRPIFAAGIAACIALTAACSDDSDKKSAPASSSASSSAKAHGEIGGNSSDEPSSSAGSKPSASAPSTSKGPVDANGREILPDEQPAGFTPDDQATVYAFGYIVNYVNKYPGWIVLSTDAPKYDPSLGGYRFNVYFSAYGGSDIILRDEFSMVVDGQTITPEPLDPTGEGGPWDFLGAKTPIGNRPDATKNYAFGDVVFKTAETQSPLEVHYDNKDGDVHITWSSTATN